MKKENVLQMLCGRVLETTYQIWKIDAVVGYTRLRRDFMVKSQGHSQKLTKEGG